MAAMVTHRSTVNMWACDQMGHMNVRHYFAKADSATVHLFNAVGLGPRVLGHAGWRLNTLDHHVRFVQELHAGAGLYISTSVLSVGEKAFRLCHEVRKSIDKSLSATLTCTVELVQGLATRVDFPEAVRSRAAAMIEPLPEYAAPRGLRHPFAPEPTMARAEELGLVEIYRGTVETSQVDQDGYMLPFTVISAISDGIPNLFVKKWGSSDPDPAKRKIGAAAVESRMKYFRSCRVGAFVSVRSAILDIGEKTIRHGHWMFNAETGEAIASSEGITVCFDLVARKAVAFADETRDYCRSLMKPGLEQM